MIVDQIIPKIKKSCIEICEIINKEGRSPKLTGPLQNEYWSKLWHLSCDIDHELDKINDIRENVEEEIAQEILLPHNIDLKKIIKRHSDY